MKKLMLLYGCMLLGGIAMANETKCVAPETDFNQIVFIEEEDLNLGFDTANYLPDGFDAYSEILDVASINFMENDEIELGFDTSEYLPEGFDPYDSHFNLDWIPYIEEEEELDLDLSISILKLRMKLTAK